MEPVTQKFWKNKRVFITGHTGFKGSWLCLWLYKMGAIIGGFSLAPPTKPSLFEEANVSNGITSFKGDIRNLSLLEKNMISFDPEILIHLAAQPLVTLSYQEPVNTFEINIMGTVNVLEASRKCQNLRSIVNVTTDKCYENKEWLWGYREDDPMGGNDPYSSSKGCSELVTRAYRQSYFNSKNGASVASARAGNVIGGGDWAYNRLFPDALKAFQSNEVLMIRNPKATRPWQHVLEPLNGYLCLAELLFKYGSKYEGSWNFGPLDDDVQPVTSVLEMITNYWGKGAHWKIDKTKHPHEAQLLKLDISKAMTLLNWKPKLSLSKAIELTIKWQKEWIAGKNVRKLCFDQINQFEA